ncbi:MAG: CoA-binding protein [Candidatus ainarchaeum sp.]|nr:CoA-binding protein [Candidatus ainarchaeum sp.]
MDKIFNPKSIAVIGASHKEGKIGNILFSNLLTYKGKVYPVNIEGGHILGRKVYKSVKEIKEKVDLVVIVVPKQVVFPVMVECGQKGVKNVVIISAGFGESGDKEADRKLKEIIKKYKIRLVGPNVVGVYNSHINLDATFMPAGAFARPKKGKVSVLSQSGTITAILMERFFNDRIGLSKFISYGNALDINEVEILEYFEKDPETDVICMYLEEVKNGKKFVEFLKKHKKPLIVLKAGIGKKGQEAVVSHTGSLAGDSKIYDGIFKQFGVIQAEGINEMILYTKGLQVKPYKEAFIITNGGGYGVLLADDFERQGIKFYDLTIKEKEQLKKKFNKVGMSYKNPLDLLGDSDVDSYLKALDVLKKKKNVLFVFVFIGQVGAVTLAKLTKFMGVVKKHKINCVFLDTDDEQVDFIEDHGIASFNLPESLAKGISIRKK